VLDVDEGGETAAFLGLGNDREGERGLSGTLRAKISTTRPRAGRRRRERGR